MIIDLSLKGVDVAHSCYSDKKMNPKITAIIPWGTDQSLVYSASIRKNWYKAKHDVAFGLLSKNWQFLVPNFVASRSSFGFLSQDQFVLYKEI